MNSSTPFHLWNDHPYVLGALSDMLETMEHTNYFGTQWKLIYDIILSVHYLRLTSQTSDMIKSISEGLSCLSLTLRSLNLLRLVILTLQMHWNPSSLMGHSLMCSWVPGPNARTWMWSQNEIAYIVCSHVTHKTPLFFHNSSQRVWFSFPNTAFSGGRDELLNTNRTLRLLLGKWKQLHCTEETQPKWLQIPAFRIFERNKYLVFC